MDHQVSRQRVSALVAWRPLVRNKHTTHFPTLMYIWQFHASRHYPSPSVECFEGLPVLEELIWIIRYKLPFVNRYTKQKRCKGIIVHPFRGRHFMTWFKTWVRLEFTHHITTFISRHNQIKNSHLTWLYLFFTVLVSIFVKSLRRPASVFAASKSSAVAFSSF